MNWSPAKAFLALLTTALIAEANWERIEAAENRELPFESVESTNLVQRISAGGFNLQPLAHIDDLGINLEYENRFSIADYAIEFEREVPENLAMAILQDLSLLLDGKTFDLVENGTPQQTVFEFAGEEISPDYLLQFRSSPNQMGNRTVLALDRYSEAMRSLHEVFDRSGERTLLVRDHLIDVYAEQISRITENEAIFIAFMEFAERMKSLESETITVDWYFDLFYVPAEIAAMRESGDDVDEAEIARSMEPFRRAAYKQPSLLDFVPITEFSDEDARERIGLNADAFFGNLEPYSLDGTLTLSSVELRYVYSQGNWKIYVPYY